MNVSKSQMKIAVINDLGSQFDDMLESAKGQQQQCLGAKAAAAQIASNIKKLISVIQQDFEKGDISKVMADGDLAVLGMIKTYVGRTISACEATSDHFRQQAQVVAGKVEAFDQSVKLMKKLLDREQLKVEQVLEAIESGDAEIDGSDIVMTQSGVKRPAGVRPGPTIKQQRLAEEGKKPKLAVVPPSAEAEDPPKKKAKRKYTRRKKATVKKTSKARE
jgi:hypothetical protein